MRQTLTQGTAHRAHRLTKRRHGYTCAGIKDRLDETEPDGDLDGSTVNLAAHAWTKRESRSLCRELIVT